jgi:hypothetical protein
MSDNSNSDLELDNRRTEPNLIIKSKDSFSNSDKSINNDFEDVKTSDNLRLNPYFSSSTKIGRISEYLRPENISPKSKNSSNSVSRKYKKVNPLSTEADSIILPNHKSPDKKKKFSVFKMVEKSKYKKFFESKNYLFKPVDEESETGRGKRKDAFGNIITRKNKKKIKVSFIDEIDKDKQFTSTIEIQSFKKYNLVLGIPSEEHYNKNVKTDCQCCITF